MNAKELQELAEREAAAARKTGEQGDKDILHGALSHVRECLRISNDWLAKANVAAEQAERARGEHRMAEQSVKSAVAALVALCEAQGE